VTPESGAEWRPSSNPWLIGLAVVAASFIEVLDTTIVSVAQPYMAGNLGATNDEASWVLTSYLISNAVILPASSWLSMFFGRKRFLMLCTAIFIGASVLCGMAPTMPALILARIVQGAGGGALLPLSQAILLESFPREKQGMAMAMLGFGVVVAPVLGPLLGGWLTDNYSWRWVFYINVPIGLLALLLMARYIEDPPYIRESRPGTIDATGFALLALWLGTLQVVLDKGQEKDWFASSWITWLTVISAASFLAMIARELVTAEPIVDLRVFRDRNFGIGNVVNALTMAVMYSGLTTVPMFLQTLLGYTAETSGVATAPRGIGSMAAMPLAGLLMAYMDARLLLAGGIACLAASTFMLGNLTLDVSMASIAWPICLQGVGCSLLIVPLMTIAVGRLPQEKIGNGSGLFNLVRNLGGSIGISVATTCLARMTQVHQADLVSHLTPYDPIFQQRLSMITGKMSVYGAGPQAQMQAYGLLNGILMQQANLKAYVDLYYWTALAAALCLPTAWLLKKVVSKGGAGVH
jgi:DHA2 family multidrug resistance protein